MRRMPTVVPALLAAPLVIVSMLCPAAPAAGQTIEISPHVGYRFGGDLDGRFDLTFGPLPAFGLEIDEGSSAGVTLGFPVSPSFQIEVFLDRQETEIVSAGRTFGRDVPVLDLDVDYYHVGGLYQWIPGQARPFVVFGLGATRLGPSEPGLREETRFSLNFGGGVKVFFNETVGLRFEGRVFSTELDEDDDTFCTGFHGCDRFHDGDFFEQYTASAGLTVAF